MQRILVSMRLANIFDLDIGTAHAHTNYREQGDSDMNIESTLSSESTVYKYTDTERRDSENSANVLELGAIAGTSHPS